MSIRIGYISEATSNVPYRVYSTSSNVLILASQQSNVDLHFEPRRRGTFTQINGPMLRMRTYIDPDVADTLSFSIADTRSLSTPVLEASLSNLHTFSKLVSFPDTVIVGRTKADAYSYAASNPTVRLGVNGNVSISGQLDVSSNTSFGDVTISSLEITPISANQTPFFVHGFSACNYMVITSNGFIGMGTSLPQYGLDVKGDTRVQSNLIMKRITSRDDSNLWAEFIRTNNNTDPEYIVNALRCRFNGGLTVHGDLTVDGDLNLPEQDIVAQSVSSASYIRVDSSLTSGNIVSIKSVNASTNFNLLSMSNQTNPNVVNVRGDGAIGIGTVASSSSFIVVSQTLSSDKIAHVKGYGYTSNTYNTVAIGSNGYIGVGLGSNTPRHALEIHPTTEEVGLYGTNIPYDTDVYSNIGSTLVRFAYGNTPRPFLVCTSNFQPLMEIGSRGSVILSGFTSDQGYDLIGSNARIVSMNMNNIYSSATQSNINCNKSSFSNVNVVRCDHLIATNVTIPAQTIEGFDSSDVTWTEITKPLYGKDNTVRIHLGDTGKPISNSVALNGFLNIDHTDQSGSNPTFTPIYCKTPQSRNYIYVEGSDVSGCKYAVTQRENQILEQTAGLENFTIKYSYDSTARISINNTETAANKKVVINGKAHIFTNRIKLGADDTFTTGLQGSIANQIEGNTLVGTALYVGNEPGVSSNVGIKTLNPQYDLHVNGTIFALQNIVTSSDRTLKTDLKKLEDPLEKVSKLTGYTYVRDGSTTREAGLIAQDVLEVLPEAVLQAADGTYSLAYGNLAALFVESIKALQKQIQDLQVQVHELSTRS